MVDCGLTYAARCQEDNRPITQRICHIPERGQPDDVWWFGFDCVHAEDYIPRLGGFNVDAVYYRTLDDVREVCALLAQNLTRG